MIKQLKYKKWKKIIQNSALFDTKYYLFTYPDVRINEIDPIMHYIKYGANEGRNPNAEFDTEFYLATYDDVGSNDINPLVHYIQYGQQEQRSINRSQLDNLKKMQFEFDIIKSSSLFDSNYYLATYPDVRTSEIDPIMHYVKYGVHEGRKPNAEFDTAFYLSIYDDVRSNNINPLVHYIQYGQQEQRFINKTQYEFVLIKNSSLFDSNYYLATYPDVRTSEIDPIMHYVKYGVHEGRKPNAEFDTAFYLSTYDDVRSNNINPLVHYIQYGANEGRKPNAEFDTAFYLSTYDDVRSNNMNPLAHYLHFGKKEQRSINSLQFENAKRAYKKPFNITSPVEHLTVPVIDTLPNTHNIKTIAIHIHCHYIDLIEELLSKISKIDIDKKIFISVTNKEYIDTVEMYLEHIDLEAKIVCVENRGRDIAPMLLTFSSDLRQCDLAMHIHTKKSIEKETFGSHWRKDLLKKLFFNRNYINNIISLFDNDETLGIVYPSTFNQLKPFMHWGKNKETAIALFKDMYIDTDYLDEKLEFPAGSMFFFRPNALNKLFDLQLTLTDFPPEPISDDGTLAHTIERCFTSIAKANKFRHLQVEPYSYEMSWPDYEKPKISIIIPVFNSAQWIQSTLESLLKQDCSHIPFEIICVDNNSTDTSIEIIEFYSRMYTHIKYFSEPKQGAGDARNKGIENAQGEYIMFVDADDILPIDALSNLYAATYTDKTVDLVTSSLIMYDEDENFSNPIPFGNTNKAVEYLSSIQSNKNHAQWSSILLDFGSCAKLYRKSFLDKHHIRFPSNKNFEDNAFIYDIYMHLDNLAIVRKVTYFYRKFFDHIGSTQSTCLNINSLQHQIEVIEEIIKKHLTKDEPYNFIIYNSLFSKLGWEFDRYEENDVYELLRKNENLLKHITQQDAWDKLGAKGQSIKKVFLNQKDTI